jgi:signal transduction histidine kinase
MFVSLLTISYIQTKEQELINKKYNNFSKNIKDKIESLILKKKNATLALTITLSSTNKVMDIINNKNKSYNLKELSLLLREKTDFKNVWFQVIDKNGYSLYRSWTNNANDKISSLRKDIIEMIKNPTIRSTISVGKYDMTFKAMVPIYEDGEFIGFIESITHFNSISRGLRLSDNIEPIIIVEEKFTKQLKEKAFTKIFLQDYYIANISANKGILTFLEDKNLLPILEVEDYLIMDDYLIVNQPVTYNSNKLASFIVIKKIEDMDIKEIIEFKENSYLFLFFFICILGLILYIISYYLYSNEVEKLYKELRDNQEKLSDLNKSLAKTVKEELAKNNEKNKILFQQGKMAALGEMIGNIAHQWRQPLSVITTIASGIKLKKEFGQLDDKEHIHDLDTIIKSSNYLSNTIDDFRYFFSPDKNKNKFNSNLIIEKVLNLIETEYKTKDIQIISNIKIFDVYSYENELLQVLLNLLNNSKDELIKVENKNNRLIFIEIYKENSNFVLKVKDNGGGINKDIKDRIFEPYFTTKHKSQGTGIGLFMSQEIVTKHMEGTIEVENVDFKYNKIYHKGALFIVTLPNQN